MVPVGLDDIGSKKSASMKSFDGSLEVMWDLNDGSWFGNSEFVIFPSLSSTVPLKTNPHSSEGFAVLLKWSRRRNQDNRVDNFSIFFAVFPSTVPLKTINFSPVDNQMG